MVYVALLRGINVGGNKIVRMKDLKAVFEATGMTGVQTYINSGNVIFNSKRRDRQRLVRSLESAIRERFGFEINLLLRDINRMRSVVRAIPEHWTNDATMKCDIMFLWEELDRSSVVKQLTIKPKVDDVRYASGAVIWCVDRKNVTKSGMIKLVGTPLYKQMTVRNCNTTRKLLALMEQR
jgi:uncharacterized protein (DUF1697 family)